MKVFVAGGTGVIGRRAVPALLEAGHDVHVLSRGPDRDAMVEGWGATPVRVDLFDVDGLRGALAGHDAVVNLATHIPPVSKGARMAAWGENDRIRREGATNLAAAARANGVDRLVQESITFPYADGGDAWIDEDAPRPSSEIGDSVEAAEAAALGYDEGRGGVVLRFAQFYAPDASHTKTYATAFRLRTNPLIGPADAFISFIGMPAAARAVVASLDVPAGVYNVADDDPPTRGEAGRTVAAALGRGRPVSAPMGIVRRVNPSAELLARSQRVDNRRLRSHGWAPDHAGAAGLAAAVAAAR